MARKNGIIESWNDDRGFGFILPSDGVKKVFVHIHAFVDTHRRPIVNEPVSYYLSKDKHGRPCADSVAYEEKRVQVDGSIVWTSLVAITFMSAVTASVFIFGLHMAVLGGYVVMSVIAFVAYAIDKAAAQRGRWRTPENILHFWSLLGGWPGALVAQKVFHHKTRKLSFQVVFWITVLINCGFLGWLHTVDGAEWFQNAFMQIIHSVK